MNKCVCIYMYIYIFNYMRNWFTTGGFILLCNIIILHANIIFIFDYTYTVPFLRNLITTNIP